MQRAAYLFFGLLFVGYLLLTRTQVTRQPAITAAREVQSPPAIKAVSNLAIEPDAQASETAEETVPPAEPQAAEVAAADEPQAAKHHFVSSVDDSRLCHICGENIYHAIHIWKNVAGILDGETPAPQAVASSPSYAEQMLAADSRLRAARGKVPRKLDWRLCQAAQDHANYCARTGYFDHHVNGDPRIRARRYGFPATDSIRSVTENMTCITQTVGGAFNAFRNSREHYQTILDDSYDLAGFAVAWEGKPSPVWVAVYGTEQPAAAQPAYWQPIYQPRFKRAILPWRR